MSNEQMYRRAYEANQTLRDLCGSVTYVHNPTPDHIGTFAKVTVDGLTVIAFDVADALDEIAKVAGRIAEVMGVAS